MKKIYLKPDTKGIKIFNAQILTASIPGDTGKEGDDPVVGD